MIAFLLLGSSELQPWAIKHTNTRSINVNLLASTCGKFNYDVRKKIFSLSLDENGEKVVKLTSEA